MSNAEDDRKERSELDSAPTRERQTQLEERIHKLETALAAGLQQSPDGTDRVLVLASAPEDRPPPPKGAVLHPVDLASDPAQRTWFLTQLLAELRLALHMYFDPRYRISRTAQFAMPGIALLILFNYFFFAIWINLPFLSPIAERVIDILLCVVGYKLLIRELDRYRDVLNYLARYGQR